MKPKVARRKDAQATSSDNVVPLRLGKQPRRLPLKGAVVRVVIPTASDLTPRQRAIGIEAGSDLDKLAQLTVATEQSR